MSSLVSETLQPSDASQVSLPRTGGGRDSERIGQNHDRMARRDRSNVEVTMMAPRDKEPNISAVQKMLAAVSGSLLTSLLGKYHATSQMNLLHILMIMSSHPSRCCSRSPTVPIFLSISNAHIFFPCVHSVFEPSSQPGRHSLLPRSLLGAQLFGLLCCFSYRGS